MVKSFFYKGFDIRIYDDNDCYAFRRGPPPHSVICLDGTIKLNYSGKEEIFDNPELLIDTINEIYEKQPEEFI